MPIKRLTVLAAMALVSPVLGQIAVDGPIVVPPKVRPTTKPAKPTKVKPAEPEVKVPDKMQPYVELSKQCAEYESQVTKMQWREVWRQNYDAATADKWVTPPADPNAPAVIRTAPSRTMPPVVTSEVVDKRECAVLDASTLQNCNYTLGTSNVRGEFAIEFTGRALSDRICDLSIQCLSGATNGPGFEFGAHWNQANFLRFMRPETGQYDRSQLINTPLVEGDKWYTVRLEVRDGKTTAKLNGKEFATMPSKIDERAWTPTIYLFQSKIAVDEAHIEMMAPSASEIDPDVAFRKVFGDRPRGQVMVQVGKLVEALEDGDFRIREAAHQLLKPMGTLTREALQGAIDAGSAEQASRAQQLIELLPPPTTRPSR